MNSKADQHIQMTRSLIIIVGSSFGKQISSSTFTALSDNSILISNTTLYCITDSSNRPEVEWSYEDVSGNRTDLSATTDASTGVSSMSVTTDVPGYYSCKVPLQGGTIKTYTVEMMDISQYTGTSCYLFYTNYNNNMTAFFAMAFKSNENFLCQSLIQFN